jgi:hypothetical protein
MIRFRTLIAAALLMIPMLAPSAAPTAGAHRNAPSQAAAGSAPPGCVMLGNRLFCW